MEEISLFIEMRVQIQESEWSRVWAIGVASFYGFCI
jgi:hypothetical protein